MTENSENSQWQIKNSQMLQAAWSLLPSHNSTYPKLQAGVEACYRHWEISFLHWWTKTDFICSCKFCGVAHLILDLEVDIKFKNLQYPWASKGRRAMGNTYGKHAKKKIVWKSTDNKLILGIKDCMDHITHCQFPRNISPHGDGIEAAEIGKQLHTE